MMGIYEKLSAIQQELKAPKNQRNTFGNYNYRSCEDILEAAKPLCAKYKAALILADDIKEIGGRFYVMARAQLYDCEERSSIESTAYAREPESKKGSDESQITGAASSYARKYALNGLFCIDDTKDADTDESKQQEQKPKGTKPVCKDCGKSIYPMQHGGKMYSVAEIAENAKKTYGEPLCWGCMMARRKANESPSA